MLASSDPQITAIDGDTTLGQQLSTVTITAGYKDKVAQTDLTIAAITALKM